MLIVLNCFQIKASSFFPQPLHMFPQQEPLLFPSLPISIPRLVIAYSSSFSLSSTAISSEKPFLATFRKPAGYTLIFHLFHSCFLHTMYIVHHYILTFCLLPLLRMFCLFSHHTISPIRVRNNLTLYLAHHRYSRSFESMDH